MDYQAALITLRGWAEESGGSPITLPGGQASTFQPTRSFSLQELDPIAKNLGCNFPSEYVQLLTTVGAGRFFATGGKSPDGIEIHDPDGVRNRYAGSFEAVEAWIGTRVLPVGVDDGLQEIAAYVWNRPVGSNLVVMSHEYFLDEVHEGDWEDLSWQSLETWIIEAVETEGDLRVH